MNLSKLMGNKKSLTQFLNVGLKPLGTSCINDGANIEIDIETAIANLEYLKNKYKNNKNLRGLYTDLCVALGLPDNLDESDNENNDGGVSQYGYVDIDGRLISVRISNHNANADTYVENDTNYQYNLSIVVSNRVKTRTFNPNDMVVLDEYVYYGTMIKNFDNPIIEILDNLIQFLKTGKHPDENESKVISFHNVSPEPKEEIDDSIINNSKNFNAMKQIKDSLTEEDYVSWLNEIGEDLSEDYFIIGGKMRHQPYGVALRKYDPIAFNEGYQEWLQENEDYDEEDGEYEGYHPFKVFKGVKFLSEFDDENDAIDYAKDYFSRYNGDEHIEVCEEDEEGILHEPIWSSAYEYDEQENTIY